MADTAQERPQTVEANQRQRHRKQEAGVHIMVFDGAQYTGGGEQQQARVGIVQAVAAVGKTGIAQQYASIRGKKGDERRQPTRSNVIDGIAERHD